MKVRVAYTVEVSDFHRRAIRHHYGESGLATRAEVVRWYEAYGSSGDDDLNWDLTEAINRGEEEEA